MGEHGAKGKHLAQGGSIAPHFTKRGRQAMGDKEETVEIKDPIPTEEEKKADEAKADEADKDMDKMLNEAEKTRVEDAGEAA